MSFGHYGPRGRKIFASVVIGVMAVTVMKREPLLAAALVTTSASSISYQIGRIIEHGVMKEKKWYAGDPEEV